MIEICFVCTGDTCRSVMAERIAKKMAKDRNIADVKFSSAGLYATGDNITENASLALKTLGYDGADRQSVQLSTIKPNVIYVAVTEQHKRLINSKKCLSFEELSGRILDPYGQDLDFYIETAKQLEKGISVLLDKIEKLRGAL